MGRYLDAFGHGWGQFEDWFWRRLGDVRRGKAELEASTHRLGEELLELVDALPFVPHRSPIVRVERHYYGHGAFMGAAPALIADMKWRRILAFLMPDVYDPVRTAVEKGAEPSQLIPMFENNPVMCAFGVWTLAQALGGRLPEAGGLQGLEWDVFIDSELAVAWAKAAPEDKDGVVDRIVDTMVIAHASSTDTLQEAIGLCQYRDVRRTPKVRFGGVEPRAWLDLFARALRLAAAEDFGDAVRGMAHERRVHDPFDQALAHTFADPMPYEEAVGVYLAATGRPRFSVVVELKSLRSTPELVSAMIRALNRRRIHVAAVGSFIREEVRGVSATRQVVDGVDVDGPREVSFFHFAGDLQHACDMGAVEPGSSVMFNGASLLLADREGRRGPVTYRVDDLVVRELAEYRERLDLHVGFYVQEGDCDAAAANLLSELVAREPEVFELGFAWGGLSDEAALPAGLGDRRGFGSQRMLGYVGKARYWRPRGRPAPLVGHEGGD